MKCTIPEISWHNREPVLSVDIHPFSNNVYKLASSGGDSHILIWQLIISDNGSVTQEVISDLTRHQKSVNTVRWSSSGQYLASADDDANIIIWQLKNDNIPLLEGNNEDKETWIVYKILRGHKEDIYDLCWSVDNMKLCSGSIDNTAILWDLTKGKMDHVMSDHKGFVQGVAWDPKNQILATVSTDRICRIFSITGKHVKSRIQKGKLPVPAGHILYNKESKYFHDDTFKSFFRRLQFSPDGSLLIIPSGHFQVDDSKRIINSTLVFTLDNLTEPAAVLPLDRQSSTVVRCCPLLFHQHDDGPEPLVKLPYRMIFAVGTDHDIILYDTQQTKPFAWFHDIHYTRITDLTWSADGRLLIGSSTDGFCSLITFDIEELGKVYIHEECEDMDCTDRSENVETIDKDENVDITDKNAEEEMKKCLNKRPSFIQQWVQNTPKKPKLENDKDMIEIVDDENIEELAKEIKEEIHKLLPRKIVPTKVADAKCATTVAKPIEVRRKPREVDSSKCTDIKTDNKEINRLIPRRITPKTLDDKSGKKTNNKNEFTTNKIDHLKDNLDKRKEIQASEIKIDSKEENIEMDISACDMENFNEIRHNRSTVDENMQTNKSKNDKTIEHSSKITKTSNNLLQQNEIFAKNSKKENAISESECKEAVPSRNVENINTPQIAKKMHKSTTVSSAEQNSSGKKDCSKIKVGSLTPKKLNMAPAKSNPLLDFLSRSNKKKNKKINVIPHNIDLTLDEDEARDGFNKESMADVDDPNAVPLEEDCTEDFSLRLEDTQDDKLKKQTDLETMDAGVDLENEINKVIIISDESSSPKPQKQDESSVHKKPRRVPLITLASPKGKKKPAVMKHT